MLGSLTRAASELQHCGIVLESAKREQVVEDLIRIIGTSLVVKLGVLIESPFQFVPIGINHRTQNIVPDRPAPRVARFGQDDKPALLASVRMTNEPRAARLVFVQRHARRYGLRFQENLDCARYPEGDRPAIHGVFTDSICTAGTALKIKPRPFRRLGLR